MQLVTCDKLQDGQPLTSARKKVSQSKETEYNRSTGRPIEAGDIGQSECMRDQNSYCMGGDSSS